MSKHTLARLALVLAACLVRTQPAQAETPDKDCGPIGSYQYGAAWAGFRGCPTGIGTSTANPTRVPVSILPLNEHPYSWRIFPGSPVSGAAVAADGTIYVAGGTNFYAIEEDKDILWDEPIGASVPGHPALGANGAIYVATGLGRVYGFNPNGTVRWFHQLANAATVKTSVVLGKGSLIFVTDTLGNVTALKDQGTSASVEWSVPMGASIDMTPALSRDGSRLYVGTNTGLFKAFSTTNGATLATAAAAVGHGSAPLVDAAANVYVGSNDGSFYALDGTSLATKWKLALTGAPRTPVMTSTGTIFVFAYDGGAYRAHEIDRRGTLLWKNTSLHADPSTPLATSENDIIVAYSSYVSIIADLTGGGRGNGGGWTVNFGNHDHLAITPRGSLIISGPNLISFGPGAAPTTYATKPAEPIRVQYDDGIAGNAPTYTSDTPVNYCSGTVVVGPAKPVRPGISYKMVKIPSPGATPVECTNYKEAGCAMSAVTLGTPDPLCPITYCNDYETTLTSADATALNKDVNGNMPTLPASYPDAYCDPEPAETVCKAINPNAVVWSSTQCSSDASCVTGQVCAAVCPKASANNRPQEDCLPENVIKQCAAIDTTRCAGLAVMESGCHEIRECAASADKVSYDEAIPVCTGTTPCDAAMPPTAPTDIVNTPTNYPQANIWSPSAKDTWCQLDQSEDAKDADSGGRDADAARNKKKKWGLWMNGKAGANFDVDPLPYGTFKPDVGADGEFKIIGRVMNRDITVLGVSGNARIDTCAITASAEAKLFNMAIHGIDEKIEPSDNSEGCQDFFDELAYIAGDVKKGLTQAGRLHSLIKQMKDYNVANPAAKKPVAITKQMCRAAYPDDTSVDPPRVHPNCAAPTLSKAVAAAVANKYVARFDGPVGNIDTRVEDARKRYVEPWLNGLTAFTTQGGVGYEGKVDFVPDIGSEFSIVGARAVFPIGPIALTLEIQGTGGWGIDGGLVYGADLLKSADRLPGFRASAGIGPFAHVDVDVFLGVGFDFGIAGASAGFGGLVTLLRIEAPVSGGADMVLEEVNLGSTATDDSRSWPTELAAFKVGTLKRARKRHTWKQRGTLGAVLDLNALAGELDVRARVRFLFFSKTWKKRVVKLPGWGDVWEWTGTVDGPVPLPALDLPVMDPLPLPTLPQFTSADFWFPNNASTMPWPTSAQFSSAIAQKVTIMDADANLAPCVPEVF